MLQEKLGQRIGALRRERNLTQVQFAKAIGCSVEFISLVERGVNAPSVAGLEKFAKVLKVEVVEMFMSSTQRIVERPVRRRSKKPSR